VLVEFSRSWQSSEISM